MLRLPRRYKGCQRADLVSRSAPWPRSLPHLQPYGIDGVTVRGFTEATAQNVADGYSLAAAAAPSSGALAPTPRSASLERASDETLALSDTLIRNCNGGEPLPRLRLGLGEKVLLWRGKHVAYNC